MSPFQNLSLFTIIIGGHLKNDCYSERRCISDQQPKFPDLKASPFSNKLLRDFQTTFTSKASAVGRRRNSDLPG